MIYDLVLEGGGIQCIGFLGALQEFEERGHTLGRLLGGSAGAITAAMLACGYTSDEASALVYDRASEQPTFARLLLEPLAVRTPDLRKGRARSLLRVLNVPSIPDVVEEQLETALFEVLLRNDLLNSLLSFIELGYWYSDKQLLAWLELIFTTGSFQGRPRRFHNMTLQQFQAATGSELSVMVSDVTDSRVLILNHRTAPYCPLIWALRMSAGLPFLWETVSWQDAWGAYLEQDIAGHQILDGYLFSPFPIELFLSDLPQVTNLVGPKQAANVLGFLVDRSIPVPGAPVPVLDQVTAAVASLPPARSLSQVLDAIAHSRDKVTIQAVEKQIVRMPAKGYHMLEFQLSNDRFTALVEAGRASARRYFEQRSSQLPQAGGDIWTLLSPPSALQYVNESASQQLSSIGVVNNFYNVDTDGGAYVAGNVITKGGDFAGRDSS